VSTPRTVTTSLFAMMSILVALRCPAQLSGGVPVRIPNAPNPECINGSTDRLWLTMYRAIITKHHGFLTSENQAEVILNVHVTTDPASNQQLTYPLSTKVNIDQYSVGQVSLPVEYTLINGLALTQKDTKGNNVAYTGFGVDTTLVNLKSKNGLGTALDALQQITGSGKIPIPSSPYTQAAGYLLDFANKAVTTDINNKNGDDKYATAALSLNIDPTGTCGNAGGDGQGFEQTGVKAIVMAEGQAGATLVPIANVPAYCWAADITPSFVIKATPRQGTTPCSDASYQAAYKAIGNDYIAFYLQRRPVAIQGHTLGVPTPAEVKRSQQIKVAQKNAQKLCDALGVKDCKGAQ
jgi:hypothetical protein